MNKAEKLLNKIQDTNENKQVTDAAKGFVRDCLMDIDIDAKLGPYMKRMKIGQGSGTKNYTYTSAMYDAMEEEITNILSKLTKQVK